MNRSYNTATRAAVFNMLINLLLAVAKLLTGWVVSSTAMLSDGMHSVTDVFSSAAVIVGIRLAGKKDDMHPYGCERLECVAAIVLSVLVGMTGLGIAVTSMHHLLTRSWTITDSYGYAWITALAAILIKEGMFRFTRHAAKTSGSAALMADAWHQRTDALSSVGSLCGMIGAHLGVPMMDSVAGMLIALLIIKAAVGIFADAVRRMTDRACDPVLQQDMARCAMTVEAVEGIQRMDTRLFGNRVLVEITVCVQRGLSAEEAYHVAQEVKRTVEKRIAVVKRCSVHIHPSEISSARCKMD